MNGLQKLIAARPVTAAAALLALGCGLGFGAGLLRDGFFAKQPGESHTPIAMAAAEQPDCPPERMVGGREVVLSAADILEAPVDPRRLGLREGEFMLTFDDGPTWISDHILDTLDNYCAKATFFMIGKRAEERPKTVLRALRDGHSLGNHTYDHVDLTKVPLKEASAQIRRGREAIAATTDGAATAVLMRPPAFRINAAVREEAARLGVVEIGPDISPKDWKGDAPDKTMERLREQLRRKDRGVILLHDSQPNTRWVLRSMLAEFAKTGRKIVSVKFEP